MDAQELTSTNSDTSRIDRLNFDEDAEEQPEGGIVFEPIERERQILEQQIEQKLDEIGCDAIEDVRDEIQTLEQQRQTLEQSGKTRRIGRLDARLRRLKTVSLELEKLQRSLQALYEQVAQQANKQAEVKTKIDALLEDNDFDSPSDCENEITDLEKKRDRYLEQNKIRQITRIDLQLTTLRDVSIQLQSLQAQLHSHDVSAPESAVTNPSPNSLQTRSQVNPDLPAKPTEVRGDDGDTPGKPKIPVRHTRKSAESQQMTLQKYQREKHKVGQETVPGDDPMVDDDVEVLIGGDDLTAVSPELLQAVSQPDLHTVSQLVRHHLVNLVQIAGVPDTAERTFFELIQCMHLQTQGVVTYQLHGQPLAIQINDDFLCKQFKHLQKQLQREGGSKHAVLESLKKLQPDFEKHLWKKAVRKLQNIYDGSMRALDISQLKKLCIHARSIGDDMQDKDVIVLLGKSGAGKSTTVHFLLGNDFSKTRTGRLQPKQANPKLEQITIGEGKVSETRQMGLVCIEEFAEQSESALYLCDTPGFGDTGGSVVGILNSEVISRALKRCRSLRVLVLCSVTQYGTQAQGLIETLQSLTRMFRDVEACKPSFFYAFTGDSGQVESERIAEDVEILPSRQQERREISDEVIRLFEGMEQQFNQAGVPFIRPLDPEIMSKDDLMQRLLALPPIENPEAMVVPFIEDRDQEKVNRQLSLHVEDIENLLRRLCHLDAKEIEFVDADRQMLATKVEELQFLAELLPHGDAKETLVAVFDKIIDARQTMNNNAFRFFAASEGYDVDLSDQAIARHKQQISLLHFFDELLTHFSADTRVIAEHPRYDENHLTLCWQRHADWLSNAFAQMQIQLFFIMSQPLSGLPEPQTEAEINHRELMAKDIGFSTFSEFLLWQQSQQQKLNELQQDPSLADDNVIAKHIQQMLAIQRGFFSVPSAVYDDQQQLFDRLQTEITEKYTVAFMHALTQSDAAMLLFALDRYSAFFADSVIGRQLPSEQTALYQQHYSELQQQLISHISEQTNQLMQGLSTQAFADSHWLEQANKLLRLMQALVVDPGTESHCSSLSVQLDSGDRYGCHELSTYLIDQITQQHQALAEKLNACLVIDNEVAKRLTERVSPLFDQLVTLTRLSGVSEPTSKTQQRITLRLAKFAREQSVNFDRQLTTTEPLGRTYYQPLAAYLGALYDDRAMQEVCTWVRELDLQEECIERLQQRLEQRIQDLLTQAQKEISLAEQHQWPAVHAAVQELQLIQETVADFVDEAYAQKIADVIANYHQTIETAIVYIKQNFSATVRNEMMDPARLQAQLSTLLSAPAIAIVEPLFKDSQSKWDAHQRLQAMLSPQASRRELRQPSDGDASEKVNDSRQLELSKLAKAQISLTHEYIRAMHRNASLSGEYIEQTKSFLAFCETSSVIC